MSRRMNNDGTDCRCHIGMVGHCCLYDGSGRGGVMVPRALREDMPTTREHVETVNGRSKRNRQPQDS